MQPQNQGQGVIPFAENSRCQERLHQCGDPLGELHDQRDQSGTFQGSQRRRKKIPQY